MSDMSPVDLHLARSCWHLVAHRCELAQDRDFIRLPWLLGDLVLYNDKQTIIAFDNTCPHRGARFFLEDHGNAPALCPYHGWSYRGGQMRVPHPETYNACDLASVRLTEFSTAWCGDFLFVALAPGMDLSTQLGETGPLLAKLSRDIDRRLDFNSHLQDCSWRVAVENALEPDHVHMVHAETLGLLQLGPGSNNFHDRNSILRAPIGNPRTARMLASMRRFFDLQAAEENYTAIFIFPFTFVTSTYGYAYALQNFMPARTSGQTRFTSRLLTARLANEAARETTASFFASVAAVNRKVFAEDHAICRRINPDFPLDGPNQILSATEAKIGHFRESMAATARLVNGGNP